MALSITESTHDRLGYFTLVVGLACVGCGEPRTVPVDATIVYDGAPLPDASVTFVRTDESGGRAAFGITDSNGVVRPTTYQPGDGVPPGSYRVVVIKAPENAMTFTKPDPNDAEALIKSSAMAGPQSQITRRGKRVRSTIPEVYADPGTTPVTCEVKSGERSVTIEITSKP